MDVYDENLKGLWGCDIIWWWSHWYDDLEIRKIIFADENKIMYVDDETDDVEYHKNNDDIDDENNMYTDHENEDDHNGDDWRDMWWCMLR